MMTALLQAHPVASSFFFLLSYGMGTVTPPCLGLTYDGSKRALKSSRSSSSVGLSLPLLVSESARAVHCY